MKRISLFSVTSAGCFTVKNDVQYVQSLTLEGCFHIHLLKNEGFSELTLNLSVTSGRTSKILWHYN